MYKKDSKIKNKMTYKICTTKNNEDIRKLMSSSIEKNNYVNLFIKIDFCSIFNNIQEHKVLYHNDSNFNKLYFPIIIK
jgi:hypothetical protein